MREVISGVTWHALLAIGPDCTYLTNSAEWAYKDPDYVRYRSGYHQRLKPGTLFGAERREARERQIAFVRELWEHDIRRIAIENPRGALSTRFRKPTQVIQPHQFGDDASKATCLWLKGLPPLRPTKHVPPRMVDGRPRWSNQTDSGQNKLSPGEDRAELRAVTYRGIARAMALQWFGDATDRSDSSRAVAVDLSASGVEMCPRSDLEARGANERVELRRNCP